MHVWIVKIYRNTERNLTIHCFFNRFCWIVWHTQFDLVRPGNWSPSRHWSRPSKRCRNVGPDLDWWYKIVVLWLRFLCSFMGHALRNLRSKMGGTFQWSHLLHVNWQQHDFGKFFLRIPVSIVSFKTSLSTKFNRLCWQYSKPFSKLMHSVGHFKLKRSCSWSGEGERKCHIFTSSVKTGSDKIIYWLCRFSLLLGFIM